MHGTGSRNLLTPHQAKHYEGDTLFARLGRAVCAAGVLPRKELHEAWEVARRVRRRFKEGRVVDLCAGYGVLAQAMLLQAGPGADGGAARSSSNTALAVDVRLPPNHLRVRDAIAEAFPRLRDRVRFIEASLEEVPLEAGDIVVSAHACGALTDAVLDRARAAGARVAVLPCCHALRDRGDLDGWLDGALAMDVERAVRLRAHGYRVWTQSIPAEVTPKNRLLLAAPA